MQLAFIKQRKIWTLEDSKYSLALLFVRDFIKVTNAVVHAVVVALGVITSQSFIARLTPVLT